MSRLSILQRKWLNRATMSHDSLAASDESAAARATMQQVPAQPRENLLTTLLASDLFNFLTHDRPSCLTVLTTWLSTRLLDVNVHFGDVTPVNYYSLGPNEAIMFIRIHCVSKSPASFLL